MPVMNKDSSSTITTSSPRYHRAIKVGAVAAFVSALALCILPKLSHSTVIGAWWPLVLFVSLVVALVSGIAGGITGRLAAATSTSSLGAFIGIMIFTIVGVVCSIFFISRKEPPLHLIRPFLFAVIVGGVSGACSTIASRPKEERTTIGNSRLFDTGTFITVLAILVVWYNHEFREREFAREIHDAGGSIAWNASTGPGYWEIRFFETELGDKKLQELLPVLNEYMPLELDLGNAKLSYRALVKFRDHPDLVRLRLGALVLSDAEVSQLKHQLPTTEVLIWKQ